MFSKLITTRVHPDEEQLRMNRFSYSVASACIAIVLSGSVVALPPMVRAQELAASTESASGADQGVNQGADQGTAQGGVSAADLGIGDPNVDQTTIVDTRVGANQGEEQGTTNGTTTESLLSAETTVDASNSTTGADSTNTAAVSAEQSTRTDLTNSSTTTNAATGTALTGQNTANENTGPASVTTGNSGIGVEQVTADNLNTAGSVAEIEHTSAGGSVSGDLTLDFNPEPTSADNNVDSFRSTNRVTGEDSTNTAVIDSTKEQIIEVQNDGTINNHLSAAAITGQNEAIQNTGDAAVATGDANVAATILNFLNTNVIDGALWVTVSDIFGDLSGNVVIPEEVVAYLTRRQRELQVNASNGVTGENSTNTVEVDVASTETTTVANEADVNNEVRIDAITGQNDATQNTGGATVNTGNVSATANTVTIANTNVVDGSLGLIIVNALNRWIGYLLGSDGSWTPIGHDLRIDAANTETGANSTNTASTTVTETDTTSVVNNAKVTNELDLAAVTGQNKAVQNTGSAAINTGDARVQATVVNLVNTTVVRGSFFAAIVNVFGNWMGNVIFGNQAVTPASGASVEVAASNVTTGEESTNTVDVDLDRTATVDVRNNAKIKNTLDVNADTGHNLANRNTGLGSIHTGDALAALHARNIANVTGVGIANGWSEVTAALANATTGAKSTNTIDVTVNDKRDVTVLNDATVDTAIGAVANTGFNTASRNTLGGLIQTGMARVLPFVENLLNQTWLLGTSAGGDPRVDLALQNTETGASSVNSNSVTPTLTSSVAVENNAQAHTAVEAEATTGNNEASRNTGGGAAFTGDASIGGALNNDVNAVPMDGYPTGSFDLLVDSMAELKNAVDASASSGNNTVSRNTGTLALGGAALPEGGVTPPPSSGGSGPAPGESGGSAEPNVAGGGEIGETASLSLGVTATRANPKRKVASVRGTATARAPQLASDAVVGIAAGQGSHAESFVRRVLDVEDANAAASTSVETPMVTNAAGNVERPKSSGPLWPWLALAAAASVAFGSPRRAFRSLARIFHRS